MKDNDFYGWGMALLENLPAYYGESDFMQQYMMSFGFEFDAIDRLSNFVRDDDAYRALAGIYLNDLESVISYWFVRTANDDGLKLWEDMLGIAYNSSLTHSERVAGILTKMQSTQTPTPDYIRSQLLQYADELAIVEHFEYPGTDRRRYTFDIHIIRPKGFKPEVQSAIDTMVGRIKPAHLGYTILYTEVTWNNDPTNLGNKTWKTLGNITWTTLRF